MLDLMIPSSCSCVRAGKDLEGSTDSGDGLRAALGSAGLSFTSQGAGLDFRVIWRNLREVCVRKSNVRETPQKMGCVDEGEFGMDPMICVIV